MDISRRKMIVTTGGAMAGLLVSAHAQANPFPELSEADPIAIALGYKRAAEDVDTTKFPKRKGAEGAVQFCDNCALYSAETDELGGCTAIRGKLVAGKGWCNAWIRAN